MFIETQPERSDVVGIACEGKLGDSDLKQMHTLLHERLAAADKPGLVVDLTKFEGYTGLAAMREDLKMDTAHRNDFSRIAVVGDKTWQEWGTAFAKALTRAEMRWFNTNEMTEAVEWMGRDQ